MGGQPRTVWSGHRKAQQAFKAQCRARGAGCWLCTEQPIDYDADRYDPNSFQLDHVIPVSVDPSREQDPSNWAPSHRSCNNARNNKPPAPGLGAVTRTF